MGFKNMRFLLLITLAFLSLPVFAAKNISALLLEQSDQLLLVQTPDWEANRGQMQFYQRSQSGAPWEKVGEAITVVVGESGTAWGVELAQNKWAGPVKVEGDQRSPVGVFKLGPAFGFAPQVEASFKLNYFPLTDSSVCVDDVKSHYYNQLLDSSSVAHPDWTSGESMRQVSVYQQGSVIQYNMDQPVHGAGSCIFLHSWEGGEGGTAGCVALDEARLKSILSQLDSSRKPVMVILSAPAYQILKGKWDLPTN